MNIISLSMDAWKQEGWRGSRQCLSEAFSRFCSVQYFWTHGIRDWELSIPSFKLIKRSDSLFLYQAPTVIPRTPWRPKFEPLWSYLRNYSFKKAMLNNLSGPKILYVWHPLMYESVGKMGEDLVCYHMYDDMQGLYDGVGKLKVIEMEKKLIQKADITICAHEKLAIKHNITNSAIICNAGVDKLFIERIECNFTRPKDLPEEGPIIGFTGTINKKFGAEDIIALANARPEYKIVLIGGVNIPDDRVANFNKLFSIPNVFYLGPKPWEDLPAYIRHFDVGLMSYYPTEWSVSIEVPLKAYEYLAAGKPVVGSGLPSLSDLGGLARITNSTEDFIDAVDDAIQDNSKAIIQKRKFAADQNSWDNRAAMIINEINLKLESIGH